MTSMGEEIRVTNDDTGAQKGQKLARFDLIPVQPMIELAKHYGRGSRKYEDRNWEGGYAWSLSYGALCRHLFAFWDGENIDEETGTPHIIAVAWHALALAEFMNTHPELDDRPNGKADLWMEKQEQLKALEEANRDYGTVVINGEFGECLFVTPTLHVTVTQTASS